MIHFEIGLNSHFKGLIAQSCEEFGYYEALPSVGNSGSGIYKRKPNAGHLKVLHEFKVQQRMKRKTKGEVTTSFHALGQEVGGHDELTLDDNNC